MIKNKRPLMEEEKQKMPMPGEVLPKDVAQKAREYAAQEKAKLRSKK